MLFRSFISEIYPNHLRSSGQSFGSSVHWVLAALIPSMIPILFSSIGAGFVFLFFSFMMVMISSNDLIVFYMGLELQSLALYVLASFNRDNLLSTESGLKYFILSALSSGLLLYGCSLIYGFSYLYFGDYPFLSTELIYEATLHQNFYPDPNSDTSYYQVEKKM